MVCTSVRAFRPDSRHTESRYHPAFPRQAVLRWVLTGTGPLVSPVCEQGAFFKTSPDKTLSDVQVSHDMMVRRRHMGVSGGQDYHMTGGGVCLNDCLLCCFGDVLSQFSSEVRHVSTEVRNNACIRHETRHVDVMSFCPVQVPVCPSAIDDSRRCEGIR